ncbi:MAG: DUF4239 domain-containing protein [Candidatus Competibacteraceae bacterium]|jgi:hypothetical protein|nr:DUF4239 domain-containing protein [Candidatus Competibacteraceae bacterium]
MSLLSAIQSLPQWFALSLVVVAFVSLTVAGFLVVHRFIPVKVRQIHNDIAGFVFATLGVTYGVLLGFVVFVVWGQYDEAKTNMENESSFMLVLHKNIKVYPDKQASEEMMQGLITFIHQAIEERSAIFSAESPRRTSQTMDQLLALIDNLVPNSGHEQILYFQILEHVNHVIKLRSLRLNALREDSPSIVWVGVLFGAFITIVFTFLFGTENVWAHIVIMSLLATLIAVVIYVVIELDDLSAGSVSIGIPYGYTRVLEHSLTQKSPTIGIGDPTGLQNDNEGADAPASLPK